MAFWRNTDLKLTDAHRAILQRLVAAGGELPRSAVGWSELRKLSQLIEVGFVTLALPGEPYCITRKGRAALEE